MNTGGMGRAAPAAFSELTRALSLETAGAAWHEVLQAIVRSGRLCAGGDARAALFLAVEHTADLRLAATAGWSAACAEGAASICVPARAIPCLRAPSREDTFIVDDVSGDPDCAACVARLASGADRAIGSCWSFAIRSESGERRGALAAYFPGPRAADPSRIELMEAVAHFAGLAIDRHAHAEQARQAEAQLRESESRYRSLTRVLTSVVWITDAHAHFITPQESWQAYTGQTWEQQRGLGWVDAVFPADRERVLSAVREAFERKAFYQVDGRLWHRGTQRHRHVEGRGMPVLDAGGQVHEWIGTCLDVDDQKRAEEALLAADRRKDEFIAVLAHELRNPLAPIRNAVHILGSRAGGDPQLAWASGIIGRQVSQMARLLDDLLDVSRITSNKLELRKTRLTLGSVLESALETSRPVLEQHGHELQLDLPDAPIHLEADPARLAQVFANLLNNAAKYTDRGGKIVLSVRLQHDAAVVSVKDNGIGIDAQVLPNLFHMFSQAQPAVRRAQGGLGIGLSLVRGLVAMHGGTVAAHSAGLHRGSEFVVRLPLAAGCAPALSRSDAPPAAVAPLRILVADDNADAAESLSVVLRMMGHQLRIARDGDEAISVAAEFRPRVALLDIGMPKVDGYQAAMRIRALLPDVLLVATTGWGRQEDVRRAFQARGRARRWGRNVLR